MLWCTTRSLKREHDLPPFRDKGTHVRVRATARRTLKQNYPPILISHLPSFKIPYNLTF
jgi:hypothetical protein